MVDVEVLLLWPTLIGELGVYLNESSLSFYGHLISHFKHVNFKVFNKLVNKALHCVHVLWVDLVVGLVVKSHVQNSWLASLT